MKRLLAAALIVGVSTFGLVGCDQKTEVEKKTTVTTPTGSTTDTVKETVKKTGTDKEPTP
jgi:hypothetical protein